MKLKLKQIKPKDDIQNKSFIQICSQMLSGPRLAISEKIEIFVVDEVWYGVSEKIISSMNNYVIYNDPIR